MRLSDFILANVERILGEWERFARSIWPGSETDAATLRDHAEAILRAAAQDMASVQTKAQQSRKSKGEGDDGADSADVVAASKQHGVDRVVWGFNLAALVAEYRALRASVFRLWLESGRVGELTDLEDATRFNETIDQSLTEAVEGFTEVAMRDRTALIREQAAREGAESANRAKDTFLAILSHELRTPLSAVVGWVHLLRTANLSVAEHAEALNVIARNTKSQVQLIDDILDVSRIVSGKFDLRLGPCDLAEIVASSLAAARASADARGVTLATELDRSAGEIVCDATRIQQVAWNLISNAVKFSSQGGRVTVKLLRERSHAALEVSDTGEGLEPDFLPHIFDRFRQADSGTRRKASGLGLGLSIVKHIVEAHGGSIEAQSEGIGRGATFIVRLPVKAVNINEDGDVGEMAVLQHSIEEGRFAGATRFLPVRLDGLRVLVVDDEADARHLLVKVLTNVGAVVTAAGGAAEALELIPTFQPEVLVSDLGMPIMDGFDLIRRVRASGHHARDLPAVALTAFVQKDDQRMSLLAGFQVHVSKPVDPHDLTLVIASLAGRTS